MSLKITEEVLEIMYLIEKDPSLSQRQIAQKVGLSLGKINYCIMSLVDIGYVKVKNFTNSNSKKNYMYILTPMGILQKTKITQNFIARKKAEYDILVSYLNENIT